MTRTRPAWAGLCTVAGSCLWASLALSPAFAQSQVSIYGIIDQGISGANDGTTPGAYLPGRGPADTRVIKAGNASRIGFRGNEEISPDLYARFQLEHRFLAETGAPSNASVFWLGRSVMALGSKTYGEIYAGREYSPAFWVALEADPTYWSYVSQLGSAYTYANYRAVPASVEANNIRWANSVGYKSPKIGGLTFELARAFGSTAREANTAGQVQYRSGPLWLGAAFDRLNSNTHMELLAAGYDLGWVRPTATYARAKGGVNGSAKSFSLAANMPTGFGRAYAQYGRLQQANGQDAAMLGLGAEYVLSKRTLVYANLGTAKRDGATRTTAYDVGIKHTF